MSERLRTRKLQALATGNPSAVLTANVGCQAHLQAATELPVMHWIVALDRRFASD
jgi:glycolate oxidase iron-sulfur subunit